MERNVSTGLDIGLSTDSAISHSLSENAQCEGRFTQMFNSSATNSKLDTSPSSFVLPFGDIVAVCIACVRHGKMALCPVDEEKTGLWFPVRASKQNQSLHECLQQLLQRVLFLMFKQQQHTAMANTSPNSCFKEIRLVHHMRFQTVKRRDFVTRLLYYAELVDSPEVECNCRSKNSGKSSLLWLSYQEIWTADNMWGTEPISYAVHLAEQGAPWFSSIPYERTIQEVITYVASSNTVRAMLRAAGCATERDLLLLYSEFYQHCFPSEYLNYHSFHRYLCKSALTLTSTLPETELEAIFRAFSFEFKIFIGLNEFITGLAALDSALLHGGAIGRQRLEYIYRYYQRCSVDLEHHWFDIRWFARDLMRLKKGQETGAQKDALEGQITSIYSIMGLPTGSPVTKESFISVVSTLKVRGTSPLFRAPGSPIGHIKSKPLYDSEMNDRSREELFCGQCQQSKRFTHASHHVRMSPSGMITESKQNKATRNNSSPSRGSTIKSTITSNISVAPGSTISPGNTITRHWSEETCNNNLYTTLIDQIGCFSMADASTPTDWTTNRGKWAKKLLTLCDNAKKVLAAEPRILRVLSPTYVFGDIHGNLHDLLIFGRLFWPSGPTCVAGSYLFLGDYVDRGDCSVECISYLLSLKLLAPDRFHLLRGNHEIREIQQMFTFPWECCDKFGPVQGRILWEAFNQVFDVMPICALIDSQIFCAHGGIPTTAITMKQVEAALAVSGPMAEPERQSPVAWQMMWNDPITNREFNQLCAVKGRASHRKLPPGFTDNIRRDTAYYFTEQATNTFLATNKLSHIIRAHEMKMSGFSHHHRGKLITVFSCSGYCGMLNEAAVILVGGDGKIRPIRVDTKERKMTK